MIKRTAGGGVRDNDFELVSRRRRTTFRFREWSLVRRRFPSDIDRSSPMADDDGDDGDDDYMSDAFLNAETAGDVRPGLLVTHRQQRLHDQLKRKLERDAVNRTPRVRELEECGRREGLEKAIDSNNKGYSLLQKMGYKPGSGIGKNNCGIVEPVGIILKTDRKGLGRDAALKEIRELKKSMIRTRRQAGPSVCEYRERRAREAAERLDHLDLLRCQRVCRQMDLEQAIQEPSEKFFWPEVPSDDDDDQDEQSNKEAEDDEEEAMSTTEQLQIVNFYLRRTYNYCVYCGTKYDDEKDLDKECSGPNRQDH